MSAECSTPDGIRGLCTVPGNLSGVHDQVPFIEDNDNEVGAPSSRDFH